METDYSAELQKYYRKSKIIRLGKERGWPWQVDRSHIILDFVLLNQKIQGTFGSVLQRAQQASIRRNIAIKIW